MKSNKKWPCIGRVIQANLNGTVNVAIPGWNMGNGPEETALFYSEWTTDPRTMKAWQDIIATGNSLAFVMSPLNGGAGPSYYGTSGGGYSADPNSDYRARNGGDPFSNTNGDPGMPTDANGNILIEDFYAAALQKIQNSSLNGFSPEDGGNYGINGTPQSWASFMTRMAWAESGTTIGNKGYVRPYIVGDEGRSYGVLQFGIGQGNTGITPQNWRNAPSQIDAFIRFTESWVKNDSKYINPPFPVKAKRYKGWGGLGSTFGPIRTNVVNTKPLPPNYKQRGEYADVVAQSTENNRKSRLTYDNNQTETEKYFSDLANNKASCNESNCGEAIGEQFFIKPGDVYSHNKIYDAKFDTSSDTRASSSYDETRLKKLLDGSDQFIIFRRTLENSNDHGVFKTGRVISSGTFDGKPWVKIRAVGAYQGNGKLYTSRDRVLTTARGYGGQSVPGVGNVYTLERVHNFSDIKPNRLNYPNTYSAKAEPSIESANSTSNSSGPTPMSPNFAAHVEHFPAANGSFSLPSLGSYVILNLLDGMTIPIVMGYFMGAAESTNVLGSFPVNETDGTPAGVAVESNQLANDNLFASPAFNTNVLGSFLVNETDGTSAGVASESNQLANNTLFAPPEFYTNEALYTSATSSFSDYLVIDYNQRNVGTTNGNHILYNTLKGFFSFSGITGEEKMILKGALQNILRLDNDGWQQYAQNYFSRVPGLANSTFGTIYENIKNSKNTSNEGFSTNESSNRIAHIAQQTMLDIYAQAHQIASQFDINRLNGQHPDCPVCKKGTYQSESFTSVGGISSFPPQASSSGEVNSGLINSVIKFGYKIFKPDTAGCYTCRGTGRSPASEGGRYPNMVSQKQKDMEKIYEDNKEILKQMRDTINNSGGHGNYAHAGNIYIGSGLASFDFDFPSFRVDEVGKLSVVGLTSGINGLNPNAIAVPLVEPVEVPDPGFGNVSIVGNRSISINSGSGGFNLSTTGNVNQIGAIYKADYVSASFTGKKGIMVDGGSGGTIIRGDNIKLSPSDNGKIGGKHVMIDGHASVNDNLLVAGGAAINGNLSVQSMTMPGKVAMTEYEYDPTNPKEANPTRGVINGMVQSPLATGFIKIYNTPEAAVAGKPTGAPLVIMEGAEYYFRIEEARMKIEPVGGETEGDYPVIMQPHAHPMIVPNIDIVKGPRKVPVLLADGSYKETELSPTQAVYAAGMVDSNNGRLVAYSTPSSLLPYSLHQKTSGDEKFDTTGGPSFSVAV
jgi:hypothetical protein